MAAARHFSRNCVRLSRRLCVEQQNKTIRALEDSRSLRVKLATVLLLAAFVAINSRLRICLLARWVRLATHGVEVLFSFVVNGFLCVCL